MTSDLFSPIALRELTLSNRIVVSPMCQYVATDGRPDTWHLVHLATLALSGAGLVIVEATAVEPEGRITAGDLGLWDDANEAAFQPVLATIRKQSATAVGIQLAHAGRKASSRVPWEGGSQVSPSDGGWECFAPSAVAQKDGDAPPTALDAAGLDRVRNAFDQAARRAARLGFDAVELHGAHGYLLHEFLSPLTNQRTDQYGGSLEDRMRFPLEVFDIVRAAFPAARPVGVRLSATDWIDGGWDLDQSIVLARALRERGADWVTASSGGTSPLQKITLGPGYQLPFAERIRQETGVTTIAVGLITEPEQAERIVASGQADLVALARGMLYDPRWGWHAAASLGARVDAPPPYWRAPPHAHKDLFNGLAQGAR